MSQMNLPLIVHLQKFAYGVGDNHLINIAIPFFPFYLSCHAKRISLSYAFLGGDGSAASGTGWISQQGNKIWCCSHVSLFVSQDVVMEYSQPFFFPMDKFNRSFPLQSVFFMTQNNNIVSWVGLDGWLDRLLLGHNKSNTSSSVFQFFYYRDIVSQRHVSGIAALALLGACILFQPLFKWHHTLIGTLKSVAKNNNNICIPLLLVQMINANRRRMLPFALKHIMYTVYMSQSSPMSSVWTRISSKNQRNNKKIAGESSSKATAFKSFGDIKPVYLDSSSMSVVKYENLSTWNLMSQPSHLSTIRIIWNFNFRVQLYKSS